MRMLKSNLLVKPLTKEQLGKIVMPDSVDFDEWSRGEVMAVGPEMSTMENVAPTLGSPTVSLPQIKIGDIVIFPPVTPYGSPHPKVGIDGYVIIPETYVWAIED